MTRPTIAATTTIAIVAATGATALFTTTILTAAMTAAATAITIRRGGSERRTFELGLKKGFKLGRGKGTLQANVKWAQV